MKQKNIAATDGGVRVYLNCTVWQDILNRRGWKKMLKCVACGNG